MRNQKCITAPKKEYPDITVTVATKKERDLPISGQHSVISGMQRQKETPSTLNSHFFNEVIMENLITTLNHRRVFFTQDSNGGINIPGDLNLYGTAITALPDNLSVGGDLDLRGTAITALPDNLSVGGDLYLRGTAITALPDNLSVGGGLYLRGTAITALPDNFACGSLYLRPEQFSNVAHRENCGMSSRTIFAVWTRDNFHIAAGCFFGTLDEFENAVDGRYSGSSAETYKLAGRQCIEELTAKISR